MAFGNWFLFLLNALCLPAAVATTAAVFFSTADFSLYCRRSWYSSCNSPVLNFGLLSISSFLSVIWSLESFLAVLPRFPKAVNDAFEALCGCDTSAGVSACYYCYSTLWISKLRYEFCFFMLILEFWFVLAAPIPWALIWFLLADLVHDFEFSLAISRSYLNVF